jgi:hypothetical protein
MCVNDWRLGRLIRSRVTTFTSPATLDQLAARNADRVGITFSVFEAGSDLTILVDEAGSGKSFVVLTPNYPWIHLTLQEHGDLPTKRFRMGANVPALNITVIEYFLPERVLSETIAKFYAGYPTS